MTRRLSLQLKSRRLAAALLVSAVVAVTGIGGAFVLNKYLEDLVARVSEVERTIASLRVELDELSEVRPPEPPVEHAQTLPSADGGLLCLEPAPNATVERGNEASCEADP